MPHHSAQISWHDEQEASALVTTLNNNMHTVQDALGDRFLTMLQMVGQALTGVIMAFAYGPKLAAVIIAILPPLMFGVVLGVSKGTRKFAMKQDSLYGKANVVATEALQLVKTVMAANTQDLCGGTLRLCRLNLCCLSCPSASSSRTRTRWHPSRPRPA